MILYIAYGTGGAEAIKEVYLQQKDKRDTKVIALSQYAEDKLKGIAEKVSIEDTKKLIEDAEVVINERSNGIEVQKEITEYCKTVGVKNIVILDIFIPWCNNYNDLFGDKPDYVTAVSEGGYKALQNIGFTKEQIIKAGNPAYKRLKKIKRKEKGSNRVRKKILYVSQGGNGNISQIEIDNMFSEYIKHIECKIKDYIIDVKLHPMEEEYRGVWEERIKGNKRVKLIEVDNKKDFLTEYITDYDLIIGKHSTLQIQAQQLGIPVIYYTKEIHKYIDKFKKGSKKLMYVEELSYYEPNIKGILEYIGGE